jgi:adenylate cyclase
MRVSHANESCRFNLSRRSWHEGLNQDRTHACTAALSAAIAVREGIVALNKRRQADGKPITDMYLGLHVGEVFYGNVGSRERLDFTVIGPAVNEVSRGYPPILSVKADIPARRTCAISR